MFLKIVYRKCFSGESSNLDCIINDKFKPLSSLKFLESFLES